MAYKTIYKNQISLQLNFVSSQSPSLMVDLNLEIFLLLKMYNWIF